MFGIRSAVSSTVKNAVGKEKKVKSYSGLSGDYTNGSGSGGWSSLHKRTDWSKMFQDNMATSNVRQLQNILNQRLDKLGGIADDWQNQAQGYVNGLYGQIYGPRISAVREYKNQMENQMLNYSQMQDAIRREREAYINKNVDALNAQKNSVYQAGQNANRAAQQNYMNVLNPNGSNNEQLAALGLVGSGLSETSAISAQNAYLNAVNSNEQNTSNQINYIDLAIQNAKLNGDIEAAQQLQGYYNNLFKMGMQNANNIFAANQWVINSGDMANQQGIENAFTQAGLMGVLNGNNTMNGTQLAHTIEGLDLDNQLKQFQLLLQNAFGYQKEQAELEAKRLANSGASLSNAYQRLYNQHFKNVNGLW